MEEPIIPRVLANFNEITGLKARWRPFKKGEALNHNGPDGILLLSRNGTTTELVVEGKKNVLSTHLPALLALNKKNKDAVVLANIITPGMRKELHQLGINYIDGAGNTFINHDPVFVWIEGRKDTRQPQLKDKPFSKTGLRIIFQLFLREDYINSTFREIAAATGASLDSVHKTINGLKKLHYLVQLNSDTLTWRKKKQLFERWITEYETRLKPGLHIGNFQFMREADFLKWKQLPFKSKLTKWGAEPAGELLTGHLRPETLTIYTDEPSIDWIRKYRLVPNPNGYIHIYQRFWREDTIKDTTPPLLVYTDLVNTGHRRNIETAKRIYEQYLQDQF